MKYYFGISNFLEEISYFFFSWSTFLFFYKYKFIYFNWRLITLQYCIGFAIHQHCLSRSIVFLYFFLLITEEGFLISPAIFWILTFIWVYLSFFPFPFICLLFSAICEASSNNYFAFFHFFFLGMVLITVSCTMSQTSIHSSSGSQSISSSPLNLFVTSTV